MREIKAQLCHPNGATQRTVKIYRTQDDRWINAWCRHRSNRTRGWSMHSQFAHPFSVWLTHARTTPCRPAPVCPPINNPPGRPITHDSHLGMQLGEEPSISQVAKRFIGTGLFRAPLPGKLNRPLLSAMLAAGVPLTSTRHSEETSPRIALVLNPSEKQPLIHWAAKTGYHWRAAQQFTCRFPPAASCRCCSVHDRISTPCTERSRRETAAALCRRRKSRDRALSQTTCASARWHHTLTGFGRIEDNGTSYVSINQSHKTTNPPN